MTDRPAAAPPAQPGARYVGLDLARAIAMVLALVTHIIVAVSSDPNAIMIGVHAVLRLATPMFIALFGAMIAIVYVRRRERDGSAALWRKALSRAIQCYLLYALNVASLVADGSFGLTYAAACLLFVGSTPYAAILKYYAVLFVALPAIVAAARRFPIALLVGAAMLVHLCFPLLFEIPVPPPIGGGPFVERLTDFTVGIGDQLAGPSILHSLVLLFMGYWLGDLLRRRAQGASIAWPGDLAIAAMFAAMVAFSLTITGPVTLADLGGMELRNANHPAYAFVTGGAALALLFALAVGLRRAALPSWMLLLSRRSLFTFGFGNVLIALWPSAVARSIGEPASGALLMAAVLALVWGYDTALRGGGGAVGRAVRVAADRMMALIDAVAGALVDTAAVGARRRLPSAS